MRKRNISFLFDNVLWYGLYLLPLICFAFMVWHSGVAGVGLSDVMHNCGLDILSNNFIYDGLSSLFGIDGVLPLFANLDVLAYCSYFISVYLLHLAVDVLLFIPRFAHNCMDCFGGAK